MAFKKRLDILLVEKNFFTTRSRARDAIMRQTVKVNGEVIFKAGQTFFDNAEIVVCDPAQNYVSRAALKLIAALDAFPIVTDKVTAIDVGASTGGFTQVLLERGAAHVIAVEVGHHQFDKRLLGNSAITLLEGLNVRDLQQQHLGGREIDLIVSDVSFISLRLALPPVLSLAKKGTQAVLLVKPQFEVGRKHLGKGGILDPSRAKETAEELFVWLNTQTGWRAKDLLPSPITGGDGNVEYLLFGEKQQ
ncbi:TlyA family RNA methyltransferase [Bartonella krasnovii]|uniref:TlyA family RNA methyltransferase n=1 Tax=Bartonella krasnovii TaxID=2267275 RepID=A0A5B9CZZ9_9HYPH|nr:TlyA family RNA methyltransferase [Bartonella krasnovii]QEE11685.1 TlyA family RNA methyltransferase [Bartonella krasnovii]UNF29447.1 TlyA family RNA methyltransferase [Bartonella krasnovii]UNF35805.1 TlyA family RNA methyltransferase [Bartonella krasnovii]UNF37425.1 TlyA family RNA methyltransferase [Bartonella krasnovii]UNF39214.1 TlyA family RNA methyltransferase [Bartonella krasnovii]